MQVLPGKRKFRHKCHNEEIVEKQPSSALDLDVICVLVLKSKTKEE